MPNETGKDIKQLVDKISAMPAIDIKILKYLSSERPMQLAELASGLLLLPRQVSESVERLIADGFVVKVDSVQKRRFLGEEAILLSPLGVTARSVIDLMGI
ncbi:MAG: helix-turn-helix domain-containing protein [Anaerolineaceae bacterium]|jgi:DNA-binding Lrp family transcriptional regulator|nr:helix-turn-helix domain-containing protein [Anaerolineaceae bacterium]